MIAGIKPPFSEFSGPVLDRTPDVCRYIAVIISGISVLSELFPFIKLAPTSQPSLRPFMGIHKLWPIIKVEKYQPVILSLTWSLRIPDLNRLSKGPCLMRALVQLFGLQRKELICALPKVNRCF